MFWLLEFGFWCYKNGFNTLISYLYGILTLWVLTIDYRQTTMFWYVRDVSELIGWVPDFCRQTDWARCVFVFLIMTFRVESYCFENMKKKRTRTEVTFGQKIPNARSKNYFGFISDGFGWFLIKRCAWTKCAELSVSIRVTKDSNTTRMYFLNLNTVKTHFSPSAHTVHLRR